VLWRCGGGAGLVLARAREAEALCGPGGARRGLPGAAVFTGLMGAAWRLM